MLTPNITILLVEDDEGHAMLVEIDLRDAEVTGPIVRVADGQAALDFVEQWTDIGKPLSLLILLDLNLPVIDGYRVLQTIKSNPKTSKIPVVVLTSTDDAREIERCYELGCNIYIRKPVDYTNFMRAVNQLGQFLSVTELPGAQK